MIQSAGALSPPIIPSSDQDPDVRQLPQPLTNTEVPPPAPTPFDERNLKQANVALSDPLP